MAIIVDIPVIWFLNVGQNVGQIRLDFDPGWAFGTGFVRRTLSEVMTP
jgi:hypothetical protein